jgi:DNA adenine methylase
MTSSSPLRYPGGKQFIAPIHAKLMSLNGLEGQAYGEAYAGGAGAALSLLFSGHAKRIFINDADPAIAAMWAAITERPIAFSRLINKVDLSVAEWRNQRAIYLEKDQSDPLAFGFATFYLNRVNHSGVIKNAGPIGGIEQKGNWKIDARFNRKVLSEKILRIGRYAKKIVVTNLDALAYLDDVIRNEKIFVYLDPPYYVKGKELYLNHYEPHDHRSVADYVQGWTEGRWIISYDDVPQIRTLYRKRRKMKFELLYSVTKRKSGKEILVLADNLVVPKPWLRRLPI